MPGQGLAKRVLVCGGRKYSNRSAVWNALDLIKDRFGSIVVIQGGMTGADTLALQYVNNRLPPEVTGITEPAEWDTYGRGAGPIRNQAMLDKHSPDFVLAFPGGSGTADMVSKAKAAGVYVVAGEGFASRDLHLDFETRSDVDLKKCGAQRYAESSHTSVLCVAWAFDDRPVEGAHLLGWPECPEPVAAHVAAGGTVVVHNASFELAIWAMMRRRFPDAWPELRPEQIIDTMALARALSLPGALEKLAEALRLPIQKDMEGNRIMKKLCKPRKPRKHEPRDALLWHGTPEEFERNLAYCKRDVETERGVFHVLPQLSPSEQALWIRDRHINTRGVYLDNDAIPHLIEIADQEKARLNGELYALTDRAVKTANSHKSFLPWLESQGCPLPNLQKDTVEKALANLQKGTVEKQKDTVEKALAKGRPATAKLALQIRQEVSKSSVSKLEAMRNSTCADGRARDLLEFHGASTGRWAGRRIQPQNMIRTPEEFTVDDALEVFWAAQTGHGRDYLNARFDNAMAAVSWSMRSLIRAAPGNRLLAADFSNIEGRMLAWLSGEEWKLKAFRDFDGGEGHDLYKIAFAKSFGIAPEDVTKDQRQIGKVEELALGYQGAHGAFLSMTKNYKIDLDKIAAAVQESVAEDEWADALSRYWSGARETAEERLADIHAANAIAAFEGREDDIEDEPDVQSLAIDLAKSNRYGLEPAQWAAIRIIVDGWRAAHARTVGFWHALENAAIEAVQNPGIVTSAGAPARGQNVGRIMYRMSGDFLYCRLPSGRPIAYPYARVQKAPSKFDPRRFDQKLVFEGVSSKTKRWQKQYAYGGLLAENVCQASSRCMLSDAIKRLEQADKAEVFVTELGTRIKASTGYPVVLHVHDEIVSELPNGVGSYDEFERLMAITEQWAEGLPIAVSGWEGERYRK